MNREGRMTAGAPLRLKVAGARSVNMVHFYRAVKEKIPSVTEETVKDYKKLAHKLKQESVRIGFRPGT